MGGLSQLLALPVAPASLRPPPGPRSIPPLLPGQRLLLSPLPRSPLKALSRAPVTPCVIPFLAVCPPPGSRVTGNVSSSPAAVLGAVTRRDRAPRGAARLQPDPVQRSPSQQGQVARQGWGATPGLSPHPGTAVRSSRSPSLPLGVGHGRDVRCRVLAAPSAARRGWGHAWFSLRALNAGPRPLLLPRARPASSSVASVSTGSPRLLVDASFREDSGAVTEGRGQGLPGFLILWVHWPRGAEGGCVWGLAEPGELAGPGGRRSARPACSHGLSSRAGRGGSSSTAVGSSARCPWASLQGAHAACGCGGKAAGCQPARRRALGWTSHVCPFPGVSPARCTALLRAHSLGWEGGRACPLGSPTGDATAPQALGLHPRGPALIPLWRQQGPGLCPPSPPSSRLWPLRTRMPGSRACTGP